MYLSLEKGKALGNAFIESQFNYALIIWIFGKKTIFLKMCKTHHKTQKIIYLSNTLNEDLLELSNGPIYQKHLQTEIYESTVNANQEFMLAFFKDRGREVLYNLRRGPQLFISFQSIALHFWRSLLNPGGQFLNSEVT